MLITLVSLILTGCESVPEYRRLDDRDRYFSEQIANKDQQLRQLQQSYNSLVRAPDAAYGQCYSPSSVDTLNGQWIPVACILDYETVRRVQVELHRRGYYAGTGDGLLGPATLSALERFSKENDLPIVVNAVPVTVLSELGVDSSFREIELTLAHSQDEVRERVIEAVRDVLLRYQGTHDFYLRDGIDAERLTNARIATGISESEEVYGLIDLTLLQSAKKVILFASSGIYLYGESGRGFIDYLDVPGTKVIVDPPHHVYFSNGSKLSFSPVSWSPDDFEYAYGELSLAIGEAL